MRLSTFIEASRSKNEKLHQDVLEDMVSDSSSVDYINY